MTHEYQINGITCEGCVSKVKTLLEKIPGVTEAVVGLDGKVQLTMSRHIPSADIREALQVTSKYTLQEQAVEKTPALDAKPDAVSTWKTYKPILLVFAYILGVSLLVEVSATSFDWMRWMRYFMAGFFLVFSFFKMLDIPAFASAYSSYDVVARRWMGWGYVYPFIELALGALFLANFNPLVTNGLAFVVMGVSTIGVVQSLLAKRRIQCACLGAVFNLPMSKVTLLEDVLMVAMSGVMLLIQW